jgi:tetratricopeptide (TPR) repeat protein
VTNPDDPNAENPESNDELTSESAQEPNAQESSESSNAETSSDTTDSTEDAASASESEASADEASENKASTDEANGEGDLPEYEPLTPELVEDEAIRGDFMLRWAIILLALLLGVRHIVETPTLVHIRSGEYLTSNGILPPANDVLSYTATESSWINLSWLFDIIVATCYGLGGDTSLSVFTGILAAIMFYLLINISRKDSPTWWNAVCAGIALAVVNDQFTVLPEIITLLGTVWVVRGLNKWSEDANPKTLWCLVISIAIWSNLDPRAYIGCVLMLGYLIGTIIRPMASDADKPPLPTRDLVITTVVGLLALMVNPFHWNAWLSPVSIYTHEIPTLLSYSANRAESGNLSLTWLFSEESLGRHTYQWICGLTLVSIAVVSCLFNIRRLNLGMLVAFLFVMGLGVWHAHELTIAAIVGCALASLNGQDWYRASCQQEYTTNAWEVLYGRLGRAATVLALATVAWLGISGRLMTADGKRVGLGFSQELAANATGTGEDLKDAYNGNIFTFRLDQGDLLIWNGQKSFVDSRVHVFQQRNADGVSIIEQHDKARRALRPLKLKTLTASQQRELNQIWKSVFNEHKVMQAIPRLWGSPPDYRTYERLLTLGEWTMTSFGSTTAVFVRNDLAEMRKFAQENQHDFVISILRSKDDKVESTGRPDWPRLKTGYQRFLTLPSRVVSNKNQKSQHAYTHAEMLMASASPVGVKQALGLALATDAVRNANAALYEDVNNPDPYRNLADSYGLLHTLENQLQAQAGYPVGGEQRYFQMTHSMRQWLILEPNNFLITRALLNSYVQTQKWDLAEDMMIRCFKLLDMSPRTEEALGLRRQLSDLKKQIEPRTKSMDERVAAAKEQNKDLDAGTLAFGLMSGGFPLKALRLLESDKTALTNIQAHLQYALALAECGRLDDAAKQFEGFDRLGETPAGATPWRRKAAWVEMARGNFDGAIELCRKRIDDVEQATLMSLLSTVPLIQPPPAFILDDTWPVRQTAASIQTMMMASETAELRWTIATCYLESGRNDEAAEMLAELLEVEPDTHLRPIARSYLELITGKPVPESQSDQIPFSFFEEEDDAKPEEKK